MRPQVREWGRFYVPGLNSSSIAPLGIPARELKNVSNEGLPSGLSEDWRDTRYRLPVSSGRLLSLHLLQCSLIGFEPRIALRIR